MKNIDSEQKKSQNKYTLQKKVIQKKLKKKCHQSYFFASKDAEKNDRTK